MVGNEETHGEGPFDDATDVDQSPLDRWARPAERRRVVDYAWLGCALAGPTNVAARSFVGSFGATPLPIGMGGNLALALVASIPMHLLAFGGVVLLIGRAMPRRCTAWQHVAVGATVPVVLSAALDALAVWLPVSAAVAGLLLLATTVICVVGDRIRFKRQQQAPGRG